VVSAADGMDAATVSLWEECAAVGMPRAVAVTRLDHPRADFDEVVALCGRVFGDGVIPLYLPMHGDDGESVVGLIGLLTQRVFDYSTGHPAGGARPRPRAPAGDREARNELIEGIIAESEDETLMDRYLAGEQLEVETLIEDLEKAVARGTSTPSCRSWRPPGWALTPCWSC